MSAARGHFAALFTVFIWGITFISTKILLLSLTPEAILFIRFLLGFLALCAFSPGLPRWLGWKMELNFAAAGLTGITLYFLLENIALQYSLAANVGVIVSSTPFFCALADWLFFGGAKPGARFYLGFACAMLGMWLIFAPQAQFAANMLGDSLALLAAIAWAFYSAFTRRVSGAKLGSLRATRRIFFYGLLLMLPVLPLGGALPQIAVLLTPAVAANLLFLGFGASALCFATWTYCINVLGVERASAYIYLVPVITVAFAYLILNECVTMAMLLGMALVIAGLILSEKGGH